MGIWRFAVYLLLPYAIGNVRELVNVIERAVSFCDSELLRLSDLPDYVRNTKASGQMRAQTATGSHRRAPTHSGGHPVVVPMSPSAPTPTSTTGAACT